MFVILDITVCSDLKFESRCCYCSSQVPSFQYCHQDPTGSEWITYPFRALVVGGLAIQGCHASQKAVEEASATPATLLRPTHWLMAETEPKTAAVTASLCAYGLLLAPCCQQCTAWGFCRMVPLDQRANCHVILSSFNCFCLIVGYGIGDFYWHDSFCVLVCFVVFFLIHYWLGDV